MFDKLLACFNPPNFRPYERELRTAFLRSSLLAATGLVLLYLLLGLLPSYRAALHPWDGLAFLAICAWCAWLYRRGSDASLAMASSWLVAGVNILASFLSQAYGIGHPVTALYLVGIVLAGMLIGGWFLRMWTIFGALFVLGWGIMELRGLNPANSGAVDTLAELVRVVGLWWLLMAVTGWLVWLFARNLERAVQMSRGQTASLARMLDQLTHEPALDTILGRVLAAIVQQLQGEWGSLFLYDPDLDLLTLRHGYGAGQIMSQEQLQQLGPPAQAASALPIWQALQESGQPLVIEDVANDSRLKYREQMLSQGIQTLLFVPLLLGERLRGYFSVNSLERRHYRPEELELAQALVQQATLAWRLTDLAGKAQSTLLLDERNRMAREIHDTLAQGFTGIIIQLEGVEDTLEDAPAAAREHLSRAQELARESLAEARRSVWGLRPQALEGGDLAGGLRRLAGQLSAPSLPIALTISGTPVNLPARVEDELLRIAQEALNNARRHASPSQIQLVLRFEPAGLSLSVRDDGRGFHPGEAGGGFGLQSMAERARSIGARLDITSDRGRGTLVAVRYTLAAGNGTLAPTEEA